MMNVDLLIRHAVVYDGSGADPRLCDVAVKDGQIVAVGEALGPTATPISMRKSLGIRMCARRPPWA